MLNLMKLCFLLVVILISSCATTKNEAIDFYFDPAKELLWLDNADPIEDFETAVSISDFRFAGLYGEGLDVPSVPWHCFDNKKDVKVIDSTGDLIDSEEHMRLKALAYKYASQFNERMLKHLNENYDYGCET